METTDLSDSTAAVVREFVQRFQALPSSGRLSDADAQALYVLAHREYLQEHHDAALEFFKVLLLYRPTDCVYLLGAALCLRRTRRFDLAMAAYAALSFLEPHRLEHTVALAGCQLAAGQAAEAQQTLAAVVAMAGDQDRHQAARTRAVAMLELRRSTHEPAPV